MNYPKWNGKTAFACICLMMFCSFKSYAGGGEDGYLEIYIVANQQADQKPVDAANIVVYDGTSDIQRVITNRKGKANFQLKYGIKYKIILSKTGYVTTYFTLDGVVPEKKKVIIAGFQQLAVFIDKHERTIDTLKFRHPFTKWAYDEKEGRYKEDLIYLKEFGDGIFKGEEVELKALAQKAQKERMERETKEAEKKRMDNLKAEFRKKLHIAGKLLAVGTSSKPVADAKLVLINSAGKVVERTTTNALGAFAFTSINQDENFTVGIEEVDPKFAACKKFALADKNGKEMMRSVADARGKFSFQVIGTDKKSIDELIIEDVNLRTDIRGQLLKSAKEHNPYTGVKVSLVDDKGNVIQTALTDINGEFLFKNLPVESGYLFNIDENDPQMKTGDKILLADGKGNVIKELSKQEKGWFLFEVLSAEKNGLTEIYADDPWLKVVDPERAKTEGASGMVIREKVFFKSNDAGLLEEAKRTLDEVANVMENLPDLRVELSSHTDSKGSDDYNLKLSEKRAKSAVDYIVGRGIDRSRISGKGYGETQLVNKCANGVDCTEEEHAQNRRLEFKVLHK
jgi:outer membrane protein OmpA-like peptidoglycan-associated protein